MKQFFSYSVVVAAIAVGIVAGTATGASAAHCQNVEMTSSGFSYFGNDHVQEATHAKGGNPGPHAGSSGASNCRDTTGSPSTRAPGRS